MNTPLPKALEDMRERANQAFDAHCVAWERLVSVINPSEQDIEAWISVRSEFFAAQDLFESRLREFLSAGVK